MKRNRRAGVEDRWSKTVHDEHGNARTVPSATHGQGKRWRARYVDDEGREHDEGVRHQGRRECVAPDGDGRAGGR